MTDQSALGALGSVQRIRMRMRKWGDRPHWEFDTLTLGDDAYGRWFGTPVGTRFTRPGRDYLTEAEHVVLVPRPGLLAGHGQSADWVATFYAGAGPTHTYVDITTPSEIGARAVVTTDLDLDVVRRRDGTIFVDDEDEFAEHQIELGYPDGVVADARSTCDAVLAAVTARTEPFGRASRRWLAALAVLTGSD